MNIALLRLPRMQRYAVSSILALAGVPKTQRPTSDQLAEWTGAPRPMLTKVLRRLVIAGLIEGERGHHGGYRLARAADGILLGDILNAVTEEAYPDGPRECVMGIHACDSEKPCLLHDRWTRATEPLAEMMSTITVAQVLAEGGVTASA